MKKKLKKYHFLPLNLSDIEKIPFNIYHLPMSKNLFSLILSCLLAFSVNASEALFEKYANSAVNGASLVERQGVAYQVNTTKPFSGRFIGYEDDFGFCVTEAGSYKNGLLHGAYEEYDGCGIAYSFKTNYKKGLEHGLYTGFDEGYLNLEGYMKNGKMDGKWVAYDYGRVSEESFYDDDELIRYVEYWYHDNGQIQSKQAFNSSENLDGISEAWHGNGQLEARAEFDNGELVEIIEQYDMNGNPTNFDINGNPNN